MQSIHAVVRLLAVDAYRGPILQGLVFSMGGVDTPLADAVASALQQHCVTGGSQATWIAAQQGHDLTVS